MSDATTPRLKVSREGVVLIKSFEGFRPHAVRGGDGRWVIGYGHTASAREGLSVGEQDAELLLQYDLLPVVRYAVERRVARGKPDYWDHATLLELAVFANDEPRAMRHLADALAAVRERWEPETTRNNLRMIETVRHARGEDCGWLGQVLQALQ